MKAITAGVLILGLLGWGEIEHWRASQRGLGGRPGPSTHEAVVVLGFRNRGNRANVVNRWRVRAGLRSFDPDFTALLVLSGGPAAGERPEAELMADYARTKLGYRGALLVETESRSTWENVRNIIPLIEDAGRIKIVSHSLHAEKARAYLWRERPDLAVRLVRARDYRFGEWLLVKPALALLGLWKLRQLASGGRSDQHSPA